jgi:hypothetical protein
MRLAHYNIDDLYALKSAYTDRLNRDGRLTARKYFYWMTKTEVIPTPPLAEHPIKPDNLGNGERMGKSQ